VEAEAASTPAQPSSTRPKRRIPPPGEERGETRRVLVRSGVNEWRLRVVQEAGACFASGRRQRAGRARVREEVKHEGEPVVVLYRFDERVLGAEQPECVAVRPLRHCDKREGRA